jgi:uncharacterized protein
MNDTPPQEPMATPAEASADDRTMAMLGHLLGIIAGFIGPLIIWLIKKDQSAFVDDQGKEALNFQITMLIGWIGATVLSAILIGLFLMPLLLIGNIIFCILGGVAANKGQKYRYPVALRLIK